MMPVHPFLLSLQDKNLNSSFRKGMLRPIIIIIIIMGAGGRSANTE
jgi:hypothetical protein